MDLIGCLQQNCYLAILTRIVSELVFIAEYYWLMPKQED
jgi:hypothetical protein